MTQLPVLSVPSSVPQARLKANGYGMLLINFIRDLQKAGLFDEPVKQSIEAGHILLDFVPVHQNNVPIGHAFQLDIHDDKVTLHHRDIYMDENCKLPVTHSKEFKPQDYNAMALLIVGYVKNHISFDLDLGRENKIAEAITRFVYSTSKFQRRNLPVTVSDQFALAAMSGENERQTLEMEKLAYFERVRPFIGVAELYSYYNSKLERTINLNGDIGDCAIGSVRRPKPGIAHNISDDSLRSIAHYSADRLHPLNPLNPASMWPIPQLSIKGYDDYVFRGNYLLFKENLLFRGEPKHIRDVFTYTVLAGTEGDGEPIYKRYTQTGITLTKQAATHLLASMIKDLAFRNSPKLETFQAMAGTVINDIPPDPVPSDPGSILSFVRGFLPKQLFS